MSYSVIDGLVLYVMLHTKYYLSCKNVWICHCAILTEFKNIVEETALVYVQIELTKRNDTIAISFVQA